MDLLQAGIAIAGVTKKAHVSLCLKRQCQNTFPYPLKKQDNLVLSSVKIIDF